MAVALYDKSRNLTQYFRSPTLRRRRTSGDVSKGRAAVKFKFRTSNSRPHFKQFENLIHSTSIWLWKSSPPVLFKAISVRAFCSNFSFELSGQAFRSNFPIKLSDEKFACAGDSHQNSHYECSTLCNPRRPSISLLAPFYPAR